MTLSIRSVVLFGISAASGAVQAQNYRIAQSFDTHGFTVNGMSHGTAYGRYLAPNGEYHAYTTSSAGFRDMAYTGLDFVTGSNSAGEFAGYTSGHAMFYDGATPYDLGTFGGSSAFAPAMNEGGQVAIWATKPGRSGIYDHGTFTPFAAQGVYTKPVAINDAGQALGTLLDASGFFGTSAFLFQNGVLTTLGTLPGADTTTAAALSQGGVVAGQSYLTTDERTHAFVWRNGTTTDIGYSPWGADVVRGVNDAGTVVTYTGQIYRDGAWFQLNDLRAAQDRDWTITQAYSIDNDGKILAEAYQRVGFTDVYKAVVLERTTDPVPEPASFAALGLGALALVRRRREPRAER